MSARDSSAVFTQTSPEVRPKHLYWPLIFSPFGAIHFAVFGAIWSGITWQALVCCCVLYFVRIFGMSAGYHRYFSHRAYKTSRVGQFMLAWLAESTGQKGVLWWAAHHRTHHKYSDQPGDVHSPIREGFLYAHLGWISNNADATDFSKVQDMAKFPELRFLNTYWYLPPLTLAAAVTYWLGLPGLFIGFCLSTVLVWHGTFVINSLAHIWGRRRYNTPDSSRNSFLLTLITLGEGWHNNHHHYMSSARQGVVWWEIDPTYYVLRALSWVGLVWDLRLPPVPAAAGIPRSAPAIL